MILFIKHHNIALVHLNFLAPIVELVAENRDMTQVTKEGIQVHQSSIHHVFILFNTSLSLCGTEIQV